MAASDEGQRLRPSHQRQKSSLDELFELEFEELLELELEELFELEFDELLELEFDELFELELEELLPANSCRSGMGILPIPGSSIAAFGVSTMLLMPPVSVAGGAAAWETPVAPVSAATVKVNAEAILCLFFIV